MSEVNKAGSAERPDALWDTEKAYSYIETLFRSESFLNVAQEKVANHGELPQLDRYEANADALLAEWAISQPMKSK